MRLQEVVRVSSFNEGRIQIGPMDKGVAAGAGRQLRRSSAHAMKRAGGDRAVALIA